MSTSHRWTQCQGCHPAPPTNRMLSSHEKLPQLHYRSLHKIQKEISNFITRIGKSWVCNMNQQTSPKPCKDSPHPRFFVLFFHCNRIIIKWELGLYNALLLQNNVKSNRCCFWNLTPCMTFSIN